MRKKSSTRILKLPLPPPQNKMGYTDDELKNYMTAEEWDRFQKWMVGQTVGVSPEGKALVYPWDADRGIRFLRCNTPTYWD